MDIMDAIAPTFPSWYDNGDDNIYILIGILIFVIVIVTLFIKRKKGKK